MAKQKAAEEESKEPVADEEASYENWANFGNSDSKPIALSPMQAHKDKEPQFLSSMTQPFENKIF